MSDPKRGVDYRHDDAPEWGRHHIERRALHAQEAAVEAAADRRTLIGNIHAMREDFLDSVWLAMSGSISRDGLEMFLRAYEEGVTEEHAKLVCAPCRRGEARLWDAENRQWTHGTERLMVVWCRASGLFAEPRA